MNINIKTPISYYGGKQKMLPHILPIIPPHHVYTESYAGGAAVFWAKNPAVAEVVNDTNCELINFYKVLKEDFSALQILVNSTLHSRSMHDQAWDIYSGQRTAGEVERAWALWVLSTQGFASKLSRSWGYDRKKSTMATKIGNCKHRFTRELCDKMVHTQVECKNALAVIHAYDTPETFHYVDPPYFNSNCGHYSGYSEADFKELLERLSAIQGKFILSSYPSEILEEYTSRHGWHTKAIKQRVTANNRSNTTKTKVEVLTANFEI